jgi:hypothetical protein
MLMCVNYKTKELQEIMIYTEFFGVPLAILFGNLVNREALKSGYTRCV